jgi:hypothetical protein
MARKAEGQIVERLGADGLIYRSIRFRAYGKRRFSSLGTISRADAERELRHVLADVERGIWRPPQSVTPERPELPTFHQFAEDWWILHEQRLATSTRAEYRWRLERHLLPRFRDHRLDEITVDAVDRYVAAKLAEPRPLAPRSINMTVWLLGAILESAVDRELIARNPPAVAGAKFAKAHRAAAISKLLSRSRRCWRQLASLTVAPNLGIGTSNVARFSRRCSSPDFVSVSCARCAGVTWTWRLDGSMWGSPRRTQAGAPSRSEAPCATRSLRSVRRTPISIPAVSPQAPAGRRVRRTYVIAPWQKRSSWLPKGCVSRDLHRCRSASHRTRCAAPSVQSSTPLVRIREPSWMKWVTRIRASHYASTARRCAVGGRRGQRSRRL